MIEKHIAQCTNCDRVISIEPYTEFPDQWAYRFLDAARKMRIIRIFMPEIDQTDNLFCSEECYFDYKYGLSDYD